MKKLLAIFAGLIVVGVGQPSRPSKDDVVEAISSW